MALSSWDLEVAELFFEECVADLDLELKLGASLEECVADLELKLGASLKGCVADLELELGTSLVGGFWVDFVVAFG